MLRCCSDRCLHALTSWRCGCGPIQDRLYRRQHQLPAALRRPEMTAHFQETTQGLSVPHLICWRTEGTLTTARRCCGVSVILATHKTADVLTYLELDCKLANSIFHCAISIGIYVDSDASLKTHVSTAVSTCFAVLHQIRSVRRRCLSRFYSRWSFRYCHALT